ncbi:MAG: hypothetical protein WCP21_21085 [Armatimonadota bacterium]
MLYRLTVAALIVGVLAAALSLSGCPPAAKTTVMPTPPPAPAKASSTPATQGSPAAAAEFKWTNVPTVAAIPAGAVKGLINGKPFEAKTVRLKQSDKSPSLEISDMAVDEPSGMTTGDTAAELDFPLPVGKPGEYVKDVKTEKTFDKEHAYFYYPQGGDKGPMSVNPSWGAALKIDSWTSEKDPKDPDVLGKVKGKVLIVFDDEKKSWVAGDFEGVYYK